MTERTIFFNISTRDIDRFRGYIDKLNSVSSYLVRGKEMRDWTGVIREFSAVLQFPYYFGYNANALYDCMGDLDWIYDEIILIIINDYELILSDNNKRDSFLKNLEGKAYEASEDSIRLSNKKKEIYFLCQSTEENCKIHSLEELWNAAKMKFNLDDA